jgi:hypothetical protein
MNALRDEAGAASEHPSEERLLQFETARASLSARHAAAVEQHLSACAACRSELRLLRTFDFAQVENTAAAERSLVVAESRPGWLPRLADLLRGSFVLSLPRPALALAALLVIALPMAISRWGETSDEAPVSVAKEEHTLSPLEPVAQAAEPPAVEVAEETPPSAPAPEADAAVEAEPEEPQLARVDPQPAAPTPPPAPAPEPLVSGPAVEIAALVPSDLPVYAATVAGVQSSIRVTGVVRSAGRRSARVQALGPDHTGVVFSEAPTLYWYLSEDSSLPVELVVTDDSAEPLIEKTISGPTRAGFHTFDLAALGARLRPGVAYEWSVALVANSEDRSGDVVSKAGVRFERPSAELGRTAAQPGRAAHAYAAAGSWYQAFDQLSRWIEREPAAEVLRLHRDALLEQVGLDWVAVADGVR